jgi:hypothetical protein
MPEPPKDETPQKQRLTRRQTVEQEIKDHPNWCSKTCQTFLPDAYRHHRLVDGDSAKTVQNDYDLCHIFR